MQCHTVNTCKLVEICVKLLRKLLNVTKKLQRYSNSFVVAVKKILFLGCCIPCQVFLLAWDRFCLSLTFAYLCDHHSRSCSVYEDCILNADVAVSGQKSNESTPERHATPKVAVLKLLSYGHPVLWQHLW